MCTIFKQGKWLALAKANLRWLPPSVKNVWFTALCLCQGGFQSPKKGVQSKRLTKICSYILRSVLSSFGLWFHCGSGGILESTKDLVCCQGSAKEKACHKHELFHQQLDRKSTHCFSFMLQSHVLHVYTCWCSCFIFVLESKMPSKQII